MLKKKKAYNGMIIQNLQFSYYLCKLKRYEFYVLTTK